ncbi:WD40 repeat domain-containing protein [Cyanobacterium sp. Dongsha4]|uniref:WD40 repeat domain-containing protein n=1 Tax=Cyanobacterium sp. DS4 TaxID=2878255 RepID=UPI002E80BBAC|nr:WD40 repeat domain-containing protein [Cyanobacterium sp. Dongsha4]WVL00710.1 WD40 repeat domain-containing protein [Cyanobacterium sp. Dongsha4]
MILMIGWFEWAEYLSIVLTIIGLCLSLTIDNQILFIIAITFTLILSLINRFRSENRTKARIAGALGLQMRRFSAEVAEVKETIDEYIEKQKAVITPPKLASNTPKSDNQIIASLQDDLDSINKSVTSIIEYIKEHKLELRLKTLEQLYQANQNINKSQNFPNSSIKLPDKNALTKTVNYDLEPPPKIAWKCIHIINAHQQSVTDLTITKDNNYLLTTSWDQYLRLWSLETGIEVDGVEISEQGVVAVCVNDLDYINYGIATGGLDQDVKIWSLKGDKNKSWRLSLEHTMSLHEGSINGLAIANEQKILLSGSSDQTLKQWDLETGRLLSSSFDESGAIGAVSVCEKHEYVAVGGGDGVISLWQLAGENKLGALIGNMSSLDTIAIDSTGELIAGGCADGSIKIWRLPTTTFSLYLEIEPFLELKGHQGQVMDLCFSPDDKLLYSAGTDGLIKIWHPSSASELGHLKISDDNRIFSLSLSKDGTILAAGGVDGTVKIWQQSTL